MTALRTIRSAVHVHSEWSYDAHWPLAKIAHELARRGYDAVLMADHDLGFDPARWEEYRAACAAASSDSLLMVAGIEYADPANLVHMPVWGVPFLGERLPTSEVLEQVTEQEGIAVLAHPCRRDAWRAVDPRWLPQLLGVELWNRKYDGWAVGQAALGMLAAWPDAIPVAALDLHTRRQLFPLALEISISGPLNEVAVLAALRDRVCRATAFGQPLDLFGSGPLGIAARTAESVRRPLARRVRVGLDGRTRRAT